MARRGVNDLGCLKLVTPRISVSLLPFLSKGLLMKAFTR